MKILTLIIFLLPPLYLVYLIILYARVRVPFVPTARRYIPTIANQIKITDESVIYDLGCGKGDFLFGVEKYHPKELIGFELSPIHIWYSRIKAKIIKSRVSFFCQDFFTADISQATIIYLFLVKPVLDKTWVKIKKECKKGTIVLTLSDKIDNEQELQEIVLEPDNPKSSKIHVYQV